MEKPTSEKSAGAYRTISEVAADLDLPQHVLRFWETRFPQVRPLKRAGGRRFYRPADVAVLRDIRARLYDEGYTIKGVQRLLRERGGGRQQAGERLAEEPLAADAGVINHLPAGDADGSDEAVAAAAPASDAAVASPDSARKSLADSHASRSALEDGLADLRGALALIEDCERILRAALAAGDGDGKRLRPGGAAL